jgi:hypothetical protein
MIDLLSRDVLVRRQSDDFIRLALANRKVAALVSQGHGGLL